MELTVRANRQPWTDAIEIAVLQLGGRPGLAPSIGAITMTPLVDGQISEPTMRLTNEAAQLLMDELWRCGLRPSEGSGSAGSLAATERHLADMRRIAFERFEEASKLSDWVGALAQCKP